MPGVRDFEALSDGPFCFTLTGLRDAQIVANTLFLGVCVRLLPA